jgi:hypothetical protein
MTKDELKTRLVDYLRAEGIEIKNGVNKPLISCFAHAEDKPSMVINKDKHTVHCFGCNWHGDVFQVAGHIHSLDKFPEQCEKVAETLGVVLDKPKRQPKKKLVAVNDNQFKEIFSKDYFVKIGKKNDWGEFVTGWKYRNFKGEVEMVDVRYDKPDDKNVVSFWYDGEKVTTKNPPVLIYNRDKLRNRKNAAVLIVEGCKAAHAAAALEEFIPVTWNGGGGKVAKANWSILKDRKVYIYPDDDQKKDPKTKKLLPEHLQAGMRAAFKIREAIPSAKIIRPPAKARSVKPSGADVVEALEVMTTAELAKYILSAEEIIPPSPLTHQELAKAPETPFRILGTDDYGQAYFVGRNDRMWDFSLKSLTKTQLMDIASLSFWEANFPNKMSVDWEKAIDFVIDVATASDFDPFIIRGRGAWSDEYGRFCYHDGKKTVGHVDPRFLYVRKTRKDIGIGDKPSDFESLLEIDHINKQLTYQTEMDAIRLLAWSTIAPFAGALPWRPSVLITGASGSGKTEILDLVAKPLSDAMTFSGGETTEPGVRQRVGNDSAAIIIEESETDNKKKKINRDALFSMMRMSTSNDAPIVAKGTKGGQGMAFAMRSMFAFMAIDPTIEHVADENRIFRVNLVEADSEARQKYKEIYKPTLRRLLTTEKTRAIRALVWRDLETILARAHLYADVIQEAYGYDSRFSLAEGILQSCYWHVWRNGSDFTIRDISTAMTELYTLSPPEAPRDEAAEMLDRILDRKVQIEVPMRETISIREICYALKYGLFEHHEEPDEGYPKTLSNRDDITHLRGVICRHGVSLVDDGDGVAVNVYSDEIMKTLDTRRGYHRLLMRHSGAEKKTRTVRMSGSTRRCVIVRGVIDEDSKAE